MGGSTAVTYSANLGFVANCGDSKAVLSRQNPAEILPLSEDHRPTMHAEVKRIEREGGIVEFDRLADEDGDGLLSVSRGFGNFRIPAFSSKPHISDAVDISDPRNEFIILGSDGLWDNVSETDAVECVRRLLRDMGDAPCPEACADALVRGAVKTRRKRDDTSAVVVLLGAHARRALLCRNRTTKHPALGDKTPQKRACLFGSPLTTPKSA